MYITARERQILDLLLTSEMELTVKDIAEKIGVSERTIHRDLKSIEQVLTDFKLNLIKKSGVGITLVGDEKHTQNLKNYLSKLYFTDYSPEERQILILSTLLESNGPIKLIGLAQDLNVTIATVSHDLTKIENQIKQYGLTLVRRKGYGIELEGPERSKRRVIKSLISENISESEILALARENIQKKSNDCLNQISKRILGLVYQHKLNTIERIVDPIVKELPFTMADSAFVGLVVHIALALERIQKGEFISLEPSLLEEEQQSKEYSYAEKIVAKLEEAFQIEVPKSEISYITMHLIGAKIRHTQEYLADTEHFPIAIKTKELIEEVEKRLHTPLSQNRSLFEGLLIHLKPTIYRLKQNMGISNPLIEKIKTDYEELFKVVKESVRKVFYEYDVPDEEVGYLVLHFGASVLSRETTQPLKIAVICYSGLGTSKMLMTRLEKEFPEFTNMKNISVQELLSEREEQYDLVISTIPIPNYASPYLLISPVLDEGDIQKINEFLNQYVKATTPKSLVLERTLSPLLKISKKTFLKKLETIKATSEILIDLIKNFHLFKIEEALSEKEILTIMGEHLNQRNLITSVDKVVSALIEREKKGALGIPGTSICLFHGKYKECLKPAFIMADLTYPVKLLGMDQKEMDVRQILLLIAPETSSPLQMEILSFISSLLVEDEENIIVFQSGDQEEIEDLLVQKFNQFFQAKAE